MIAQGSGSCICNVIFSVFDLLSPNGLPTSLADVGSTYDEGWNLWAATLQEWPWKHLCAAP